MDKSFHEGGSKGHSSIEMRTVSGGYETAAQLVWLSGLRHFAVYGPDGIATYAMRVPGGSFRTIGMGPSRRWLGLTDAALVPLYVQLNLGDWTTVTHQAGVNGLAQGAQGSDDVLGLWLVGGTQVTAYDVATQGYKTLTGTPGIKTADAYADTLYVRPYKAVEQATAAVWTQAGGMVTFIDPTPDVILDVKTDGNTLLYVTAPVKPPADPFYSGCELWTSPHTTTAAGLQAQKLRDLAGFGSNDTKMAKGYYAFWSPEDGNVHVIRLADGRHWTVVMPRGENFFEVEYVDDAVLVASTHDQVYKFTLAELGPGDP